ncbi:AMINE OXIDASE [Salix purpurea]|uniref:AMINE OXIDASE n=1 Tax=Salix purpurea TaxID=77065 RepID=A0A9Q0QE89_SALPP|nr:AMINE OXIDASE [Salix purpurea]
MVAGFYSFSGFTQGKIEVQDNSVVGSQSLILPGSVVQKDVILGALSVAPANSILQQGGVYIGSQTPVMIKNTMHALDDRIEEMDFKYKKIVGNLAANLVATTLTVKTRYFHRIGVGGKGYLKIYQNLEGLSDHTIADFATWLVCGLPAREQHVKRVPHIRDVVWMSLCNAHSFAELHYYSNICRLFRFSNGQEMYVKFKLRPGDENISEDSGKVEPMGILPPETGAIPRDEKDTRPLLFLAEDFQSRVSSPGGVRYIFQLQNSAGEIHIDQNLTSAESEELEFNPYIRCHEVDVIWATSSSQSASIDHGRSLIYEICHHLRNGEPLPEAWRIFIEQSDVKVDLSGCPMTVALEKKDTGKVTLAKTWYQTLWVIFAQPLLQTFLPCFLMGLLIFAPLNCTLLLKESKKVAMHWLLPLVWVSSGILAALASVMAKWILVGKKKEGQTVKIWSTGVFMDTLWQAFRTVVGDYFMEMTSGSILFLLWLKLMGSDIGLDQGAYVDSVGAALNPEMVEIERGGCVGREALLFGHIYEGGGRVQVWQNQSWRRWIYRE